MAVSFIKEIKMQVIMLGMFSPVDLHQSHLPPCEEPSAATVLWDILKTMLSTNEEEVTNVQG